jgi:hypothetical protein
MLRTLITVALTALLSTGLAQEGFTWSPDQFPEGDQTYVLQVTNAGNAEGMTLRIEVVQGDAGYDVTTTIVSNQTGLTQDDLGGAAFGGSMMGGLALGPMLFYGPMFMMLPLMLGQEEIRVRTEPMVVMGMGRLIMDSTVEIAGHTCVEIRFEANDDPDATLEFALADGVPFPCYTRFGSGDDAVEMLLIEATP